MQSNIASPYKKKEDVKTLSAEEKVRVLKAALRSRQKTGGWNWGNKYRYSMGITYSKQSLALARRFFELNPDLTVEPLLQVLDACCAEICEQPCKER